MILSGDDLTTITPARLAMLKKLQPPTARAARFADTAMQVGVVDLGEGRQAFCLLNWDDAARDLSFTLPRTHRVRELWSDEDLGVRTDRLTLTVPPHGGQVLICDPI